MQHDPDVCGLWCYDLPPLCPACRAELAARGLCRWEEDRGQDAAQEQTAEQPLD
jgi:hypothetical protein